MYIELIIKTYIKKVLTKLQIFFTLVTRPPFLSGKNIDLYIQRLFINSLMSAK